MEHFIENIILIPFLCGSIFLIMAIIMYYHPPKEINDLYGYRTRASKKSQERWDFAQRHSSVQFIKTAVVLVVIGLGGYVVPASFMAKFSAGIFITIFAVAFILRSTEAALKKRFGKL